MAVVENGGIKQDDVVSERVLVANGGDGGEREEEEEGGRDGSVSHEEEESEPEGAELDPREGAGPTAEDEGEMKRLWGPLKGPVQVKIADLGNACWVVSALESNGGETLSYQNNLVGIVVKAPCWNNTNQI